MKISDPLICATPIPDSHLFSLFLSSHRIVSLEIYHVL